LTRENSPDRLLDPLVGLGIRLGLDGTRQLLARLGSPERRLRAVLVAGTNGKGSTAATLASIGRAAGIRAGLYTSPHLESVEERIRIDGCAIDSKRLAEALEVVLAAARETGPPPTYFEALTVACFWLFERAGVELAILEVGLGGRLDTTNLSEPVLSIVTSIGLDHMEYLGTTLEQIAREKAGILRAGAPALIGSLPEPARGAVGEVAAQLGTELHELATEVRMLDRRSLGWRGQVVQLETARERYRLQTVLLGEHQARNLALAVRASELLADAGWSGLDRRAIEEGVARARWPGRLELVPVDERRRVVLDGAHNRQGVESLAKSLVELSAEYDLIFGAMREKEIEFMLPPLVRDAHRVWLTTAPGERGLAAADLLPWAPAAEVFPEPEEALDRALASSARTVLITGSLYLVGQLRAALRRRLGRPAAAVASLFDAELDGPPR
jgi:dihydrofolate synthase/folylpolyglutamate synthase